MADPESVPAESIAAHSRNLSIAGCVSVLLYAAIAWLSWRFEFHTDGETRPILAVMFLFACAFTVYAWATFTVCRSGADRAGADRAGADRAGRGNADRNPALLKMIIFVAIVFRVVMLFSLPIQEVDIYRYLWDGAVSNEGISPFAYSPLEVRQAAEATGNRYSGDRNRVADLARLTALRDSEPALDEILSRVHFSELPTIYPATSQTVFAAVDWITPPSATLVTRVFLMKACLIGFDIATLFTVVGLLRLFGQPSTWVIAYAWCPLLMKEFAGSGHLDAIAVFLTALTIFLATQILIRSKPCNRLTLRLTIVGFVFALAVGSKLYPIILAPLFLGVVAKRFGFQQVIAPAVTAMVVTAALLAPMMPGNSQPTATDPSKGVTTFLQQWEMNDFIFLLLLENLRPAAEVAPEYVPWFSVVPDGVRTAIAGQVTDAFGVPSGQAAFAVSRVITLGVFALIAIGLTVRVSRISDPVASAAAFVESAFLTLAWFWLLCPTQNPWYWTWALPFLPFARGRAWIAVSGLVLIYYLRFWFDYHYEDVAVLGTPYRGVTFYDFVFTWIEYAPFFVWLAVDHLRVIKVADQRF
jgi:hypothetical protein